MQVQRPLLPNLIDIVNKLCNGCSINYAVSRCSPLSLRELAENKCNGKYRYYNICVNIWEIYTDLYDNFIISSLRCQRGDCNYLLGLDSLFKISLAPEGLMSYQNYEFDKGDYSAVNLSRHYVLMCPSKVCNSLHIYCGNCRKFAIWVERTGNMCTKTFNISESLHCPNGDYCEECRDKCEEFYSNDMYSVENHFRLPYIYPFDMRLKMCPNIKNFEIEIVYPPSRGNFYIGKNGKVLFKCGCISYIYVIGL